MKRDHITTRLDDYLFGEIGKEERQAIAEHLLVCEGCRREHDELKLGASLLSKLPAADAPQFVWASINNTLDGRGTPNLGLIPQAAWLDWRKGFALAVSLAAVSILAAAVYIGLFTETGPQLAGAPQNTAPAAPPPLQPPAGTTMPAAVDNSNTHGNSNANAVANTTNANSSPQPSVPQPSWQVETIAGTPTIGNGSSAGQIAVGQMLETDARSKAKITVASIGSVEVAPNTLVKLVGTGKDQHRLALERGQLHARILAPPRLFVVDTPSGQAVDLGCEYTLKVDRGGNSTLHVTSGFVAFEDKGRESIVPAGMMSQTRKGKGLGTPFRPDADAEFKRSLERFDFGGGGRASLQALLAQAEFYDIVTLWHLLSRAAREDRGAVFDKLAKFVAPPAGVTSEGIASADKKMLAAWRAEVEESWFN